MKNIVSIIVLFMCIFTFSRCSEDAYDEKYSDPNKVTKLLMDKLMTGIFKKEDGFNIQGGYRYFSSDSQWLGKYAQTFGFYTGGTMYHNAYTVDGIFSEFYAPAANFKKLEEMYLEMPDAEKPEYEAYYLATKIQIYCHLVAILDVFGDVPWSDACMVALTGDYTNTNASFDKATDLYKMVIDEMKAAGLRFAENGVKIPKGFTATQDYINNADRKQWQMYANSLCLRTALRVASNGTLTDLGRATIMEILENPTIYPVVENNDQNIQIKNLRSDPVNAEGGGGLGDWVSCRLASGAIVKNMLSDYNKTTYSGTYQAGIDDPRLPILFNMAVLEPGVQVGYPVFDPNKREATVFRGTNTEMNESLQNNYIVTGFSEVRENGFFWRNENWDHQIYSAAETWFIKAEAYQNGWAQGDAKAAFKEGIKQSIHFFFKYQANKSRADYGKGEKGDDRRGYVINPNEPTDTWIDQFAEARWNTKIDGGAYDSGNPQLDAIITQKWLNFNILYVREAWNDLRRTGYPSGLVFPAVADSEIPNVPVRWKYAPSERDFNKNFSQVADQDNYYTKMFWAK